MEPESLFQDYFEGRLDPAACKGLVEELSRDPAIMDDFLDQLQLHRQLAVLLEKPAAGGASPLAKAVSHEIQAMGDSQRFSRAVIEQLYRKSPVQRTRRHPRLGKYLAFAAGGVLVMGVWLVMKRGPSRGNPATELSRTAPLRAARRSRVSQAATPLRQVQEAMSRTSAGKAQLQTEVPTSSPAPPKPRSVSTQAAASVPPIPMVPEPLPARKVDALRIPEQRARTEKELGKPATADERRETTRPMGHIAKIEGRVRYARGGQGHWVIAQEGISLLAGDVIDTQMGRARIQLGVSTIYANRRTVLHLLPAGAELGKTTLVQLEKGEVFVDDKEQRTHVETPDGLLSPVGTRFDVYRRLSATIVTVVEGTVEARTKRKEEPVRAAPAKAGSRVSLHGGRWLKGALRITAGHQVLIRRGLAPGRARATNVRKYAAWRGKLEPQRDIVLQFDFEDGKRPWPWTVGKVLKGPDRGLNRFCLAAEPDYHRPEAKRPVVRLHDWERGLFAYAEGSVLSFDYWVPQEIDGLQFWAGLRDGEKRYHKYVIRLTPLKHQIWTRATLPLKSLLSQIPEARQLVEGDTFVKVLIYAITPNESVFYVDNVTIARHPSKSIPGHPKRQ